MSSLTELGTLVLRGPSAIADVRRKVLSLATTLGADVTAASPIAAAVSELGRGQLATAFEQSPEITISLQSADGQPGLVFDFRSDRPANFSDSFRELFDELAPTGSVEQPGIRALRKFPAAGITGDLLERLTGIVQLQSRDELFHSIRSKNDELSANQERLEEARVSADSANTAKSQFLATMSHEIRTPMNAILNMTQLALDSEVPGKTRRYLEVVQSSGNNLLSLINDILDFSKIEAGKIDLEEIPFSLHHLLDELTDSFRGKTFDKKLEFVAGASHKVPAEIVGDPLRIRQVLINLIGNAFKFTDQGEIVLTVNVVKEEQNPEPPADATAWLHFSVRDTGIGIPKEKQGKLFQSFSQVDSSTTRKYGGTGLGLAISKKLVSLMGGDLAITSEAGEGTDFHFTAPFRYDPAVTHEDYASRLGNQAVNVLVVEDSPSSADLFSAMLVRFGMSCEVAPTAEEAFRRLVTEDGAAIQPKPDIILMDWLLPGMDGIDATGQIRTTAAISDIPIVMVSAFASETHESKALERGANAFIQKPVTASTLFDSIFRLLDTSYSTAFFRREDLEQESVADQMAKLKGARILMAEDNEANQFVVEEIFGHVGIDITIANHGLEALELIEADETGFDGILMDMQMPEMDGLTATREIRKRWPDVKLPIIALTANAMKGDMERCREAGMDDYVSKPIDRNQLFRALLKWVEVSNPTERTDQSDRSARPAEDAIPTLPGIDIDDALKRLGLPWPLIKKMLLRFADGQPDTRDELRSAIDAWDWEAARRHAHSVAGASGNLSAVELSKSAKDLENAIKAETGDYEALFATMNRELESVLSAINSIRPKPESVTTADDQPVDNAAVKTALEDLKARLDEGDMSAIETAMESLNGMGIPADLRPGLAEVRKQVEGYDYFTAADEIEKVITLLA